MCILLILLRTIWRTRNVKLSSDALVNALLLLKRWFLNLVRVVGVATFVDICKCVSYIWTSNRISKWCLMCWWWNHDKSWCLLVLDWLLVIAVGEDELLWLINGSVFFIAFFFIFEFSASWCFWWNIVSLSWTTTIGVCTNFQMQVFRWMLRTY